jgi:hypothetical protein
MLDPNNLPGGETLILTAKSANKIQWFDAGSLEHLGDLDMPASTHELIRSLRLGVRRRHLREEQ